MSWILYSALGKEFSTVGIIFKNGSFFFSLRGGGGLSLAVFSSSSFSGRYFYILFIEAMVLFKFKELSWLQWQ